ncbi:MAG: tetratricopeptide repeat protein, partial [Bacteroidota bacterium]
GAVLVNYTNIGAVNYDLGNYLEGMKAHEKALEIARKQGNTRAIAQCFFQLGTGHHYQSNLVRALDFYQKALHILQELKNPGLIAKVYNQMGNIYVVQKQYEKGIEYHQKALEINQELGNKSGIAYAYNILGDDHIQKNEFTQASRYFQKGLDLYRELEIPQRAGQCLRGLGQCYFYLKDYPESLSYANQSLELFLEANSQADIFNARALRADVFLASKKTDQAIQEGEKAYLIARDLQNPEIIKSISKTLADAYEVQGRFQKAYDYYKIFKANSDSVLNIGKVKELTTLENQFQYNQEKAWAKADREQKEAELAGKIQQQQNLRNAFIIGFALVLLLAFFILRSYLIKRKANRALSEKNELISLQAEELKITNEMLAEMDRFKQQMTGMLVHDLKNPLNAIIGLAEQDYQAQHQKTIYQSGQNMLHLVVLFGQPNDGIEGVFQVVDQHPGHLLFKTI